jgi:hypothetical protein
MATTSETTYTHTCDLCGKQKDQDELTQLYGKPDQSRGPVTIHPKIDICADCGTRPVADVIAWFKAKVAAASR